MPASCCGSQHVTAAQTESNIFETGDGLNPELFSAASACSILHTDLFVVDEKLKNVAKCVHLRPPMGRECKTSPVFVDEDSMSDWSTDSCGWSDEDYGVDLDFTTPPLSVDSGAVETGDQEIVRCICEVEEENDFMIQVSCRFPLP